MIKLTITFILLIVSLNSFAQVNYPTHDSAYIFWQPGITLTYNDFRGDTVGGKYTELYKKVGLQSEAYIGLWSILDVPKKKKDRGRKLEKVYVAPAFDKTASYAITNDTMEIAIQQVYFDIAETWARWARQQLSRYQDSMKGYGVSLLMYSTVIKDAKAGRQQMNSAYAEDVIISKKQGAFEKWRKLIDNQLNETALWATKPEDCYRFIVRKAIDKEYEESPVVVGVLPSNR
ncbi:hypothetical protein SAMN05428988_1147 [Chitinophaga sp. YR573]|uniref:hypothetical protein n=1 Tax=Chitinophaga sp. YR573 TaxID=1881040 RepID=UPI0008ABF69E|nr:hypothetical protein [Chitinophaga sp. YR573]SEW00155.1 hypothetical protein SAMN05428988_1147 [Chitinophaga sp. YR573]